MTNKSTLPSWKEYQETAADFFRSIDLLAETDQTLTGVRTTHDIDVVVRSSYAGFDTLWIVECKHWEKGEFVVTPAMSKKQTFTCPDNVGTYNIYRLYHEELESLCKNIKGILN